MGAAVWEGRIAPGRVSHALVSSLDILPTVAALSGVALPDDRSYDGVDLSELLLHGGAHAHRTLFHPEVSEPSWPSPSVPAMRLGRYKAFFVTASPGSCHLPDGTPRHGGPTRRIAHDPPLVFDLSDDPGESEPLDTSTLSDELAAMRSAMRAFWTDVNKTMRSATDYSEDWSARPCANALSSCCRLDARAASAVPRARHTSIEQSS